jgi:hypothetical protein
MEIKETKIILMPEEIIEIIDICESSDQKNALLFIKKIKKKIEKVQTGFRSSYQRGGHIGQPKF